MDSGVFDVFLQRTQRIRKNVFNLLWSYAIVTFYCILSKGILCLLKAKIRS